MAVIDHVIQQLQVQRKHTERELERLNAAIKALTSGKGLTVARRKPKFSAAGIARIRAAQKARWAKIKAANKGR